MQPTLTTVQVVSRASLILAIVCYAAIITFGIVLLALGSAGGWLLVGIGLVGLGIRILTLFLRSRQRVGVASSHAEPAGDAPSRAPTVTPDETATARQTRALKIRVAGFCIPFAVGAIIAFAFIFTSTGEFEVLAIVLAVVFTVVVCLMVVALLTGLRNIRTGRSASL